MTDNDTEGNRPGTSQKISKKWQVAFMSAMILLCAIIALMAILLIRSGFFTFAAPITQTQYKALWTFLASALGAAITLIGLTLTHSHNARTLALQIDIEKRRALLERETENRLNLEREQRDFAEREAEKRLNLETVVKGLQLVSSSEGNYAVSAQVAGSLAALVHLEHPVIAMRALRAAWQDKRVDVATAVWLINEVLDCGSPASQVEASFLLCDYAADLCDKRYGHPGEVEWPKTLYSSWPINPPRVSRFNLLFAIVLVLISQNRAWWGYGYDWTLVLLDEAMKKDKDAVLKDCACHLLEPIIKSYARESSVRDGIQLPWGDDVKKLAEIDESVRNYRGCGRTTGKTRDLVRKLEDWARDLTLLARLVVDA